MLIGDPVSSSLFSVASRADQGDRRASRLISPSKQGRLENSGEFVKNEEAWVLPRPNGQRVLRSFAEGGLFYQDRSALGVEGPAVRLFR